MWVYCSELPECIKVIKKERAILSERNVGVSTNLVVSVKFAMLIDFYLISILKKIMITIAHFLNRFKFSYFVTPAIKFSGARNKGNPKLVGAMRSNPKIFDCEPNSTSFNGNYPLLSSNLWAFSLRLWAAPSYYMGAVEEEQLYTKQSLLIHF